MKKLCGLLGLAAKAGKVQSGEFCTERSVKSGHARLCIIAEDASDQTKKAISDMCAYRKVPVYTELVDKEMLGHVIGKGMRASLTVEDTGFAERMQALILGTAQEQKGRKVFRDRQEGGDADGK